MSRPSQTIRLVSSNKIPLQPVQPAKHASENEYPEMIASRQLSDKASLLRPLKDEHLLEVYREAKRMNLSAEFIELLEDAIEMRQLEHRLKA
ncbi:sporulation histidine kinase inhibitor Sda [Cohnella fermenti]|uniref:sporulation histidine kinase inhibitor Sda n=1 Tax=Cohnella fermenti TaxID=2565925 RepID=UPI001E291D5E|nr:sporulation histidine kinase inhibitor Sda [Cohnella fermenti]